MKKVLLGGLSAVIGFLVVLTIIFMVKFAYFMLTPEQVMTKALQDTNLSQKCQEVTNRIPMQLKVPEHLKDCK